MTPTYLGRIQTRFFLLAVVGGLWTLAITPLLPGGGALGDRYQATFTALAVVFVVGIGWEALYHFLQQFRWEKDWPILFGLLEGVPEGIVAWLVLRSGVVAGDPAVDGAAFAIHFGTTWLVTWLFVIGPMRVPFLRWRFRGGRLI